MNLFFNILASSQGQSLLRSLLKIGGTALIASGHGDPSSVDTIIGGVVALVGILNSMDAHSNAVSSSQN